MVRFCHNRSILAGKCRLGRCDRGKHPNKDDSLIQIQFRRRGFNVVRSARRGSSDWLGLLLCAICFTLMNAIVALAQTPRPWPFGGGDIYNSRGFISTGAEANSQTQINATTAPHLALRWSLTTGGAITATPTAELGGLYVPDYSGMIYKVRPDLGTVLWSHNLSDTRDYTVRCRAVLRP